MCVCVCVYCDYTIIDVSTAGCWLFVEPCFEKGMYFCSHQCIGILKTVLNWVRSLTKLPFCPGQVDLICSDTCIANGELEL